jgi:NADH-quinone oxidoreductase subunit L
MFRLVYLAFFGERRHAAPHAPDAHAHADAHGASHGHGGGHSDHLHDAPPAMAIALVVLAIGSVAAGYVGVPDVLVRGGNRIEAFLEPSFRAPGEAAAIEVPAETGGASEMSLMAISTVVALAGIGLATVIYIRRPETADELAARFRPIQKLLLGKYYVDEIYDGVVVQPIKRVSTVLLWRGVDVGLIDSTVNGVGLVVRGFSAVLRRLQTGSVRTYATSLFLGVIVIVGYYLWR